MLDEGKRKAMAAAARAHVEKLGWMAAVKRIRDTQYQRAINTFRAHKRCEIIFTCSYPAIQLVKGHILSDFGNAHLLQGWLLVQLQTPMFLPKAAEMRDKSKRCQRAGALSKVKCWLPAAAL